MTGAKPDPRLRTPMQWTTGPGAGFTRGTPWERLADDSASIAVAAQEHDAESLLALHRRLIHLRDRMPALAGGSIVPLSASNDAVLAYLRRDGGQVVLVIANLGTTPLTGVTLTSDARALPPGAWLPRDLLGTVTPAALRVDGEGRVAGYVPFATLAGARGYLFSVIASRGTGTTRRRRLP